MNKCPGCGAVLIFDPYTQRERCPDCGYTGDISDGPKVSATPVGPPVMLSAPKTTEERLFMSGMKVAKLSSRLGAWFLDALMLSVIASFVIIAYAFLFNDSFFLFQMASTGDVFSGSAWGGSLDLMLLFLLFLGASFFLYSAVFEFSKFHATPGKIAFKLMVLDEDSLGGMGFCQAVLRNIFRVLWYMLPPIGLIIALVDVSLIGSKGKRLGDMAAHTIVVKEDKSFIGSGKDVAFAVPEDADFVPPPPIR